MGAGRLPKDGNQQTVQVPFAPGQSGQIPFSLASAQGSLLVNAVGGQNQVFLDVTVTQPAFIKFVQSSGAAASTDMYLAANWPRPLIMPAGMNRIAVIGASSIAGTLYFTERL